MGIRSDGQNSDTQDHRVNEVSLALLETHMELENLNLCSQLDTVCAFVNLSKRSDFATDWVCMHARLFVALRGLMS